MLRLIFSAEDPTKQWVGGLTGASKVPKQVKLRT